MQTLAHEAKLRQVRASIALILICATSLILFLYQSSTSSKQTKRKAADQNPNLEGESAVSKKSKRHNLVERLASDKDRIAWLRYHINLVVKKIPEAEEPEMWGSLLRCSVDYWQENENENEKGEMMDELMSELLAMALCIDGGHPGQFTRSVRNLERVLSSL
jgi:hypothetical protein